MNDRNILFTSLGKALSTRIKYMTQVKLEEKKGVIKEIIFCLSSDEVILLDNHMHKYGIIKYDQLKSIYMEKHERLNHRTNLRFSLNLKEKITFQERINFQNGTPEEEEDNEEEKTLEGKTPNDAPQGVFKTDVLNLISEDRAILVKNILCFYGVHYLYTLNEVKTLPTEVKNIKATDVKKEENKKEQGQFKFFTLQDYSFFVTHKIKNNIDNHTFFINTSQTKKEFLINITISPIIEISTFEVQKDLRELPCYAYSEACKFMQSNTKVNNEEFKILKNSIFHKKYNFSEDKSQWEAWQIKARKCHITKMVVKNYYFIFLRRKFIFPYYNTFRNFRIILQEETKEDDKDFSPEAIETIELLSNSLAPLSKLPQDFTSILESRMNSLLLDEEILTFYFNNLKINEVDIVRVGFLFLFAAVEIIITKSNENNDKGPDKKILEWRTILINSWQRIRQNSDDDINKHTLEKIYSIYRLKSKKLDEILEEIYNFTIFRKVDEDGVEIKQNIKCINKLHLEENIRINEEEESISGKKKINGIISKKDLNWMTKVNRFIYFCMNGGLCDYAFNFNELSAELTKFLENNTLFYRLMNILEVNRLSKKKEDENHQDVFVEMNTINEKFNIFFNEDAICGMIKTGTLLKIYSDNVDEAITLFKILIREKYSSNKILLSIYSVITQLDDQQSTFSQYIDRNSMMELIPGLILIFRNSDNLQKLKIVGKCLANLTKSSSDKTSRLSLIQPQNLQIIFNYLKKYKFDESFIIILFDIIDHIIDDMNNKLSDFLYGSTFGLMDIFKKYLGPSSILGTFNSQNIMIIILTMLLKLTKSLEACIKEKFCEDEYSEMFNKLIDLVDGEGNRKLLIDPTEELSFVLEFKVFYLLGILIFKNSTAKNLINNKYDDIFDFFHRKSLFYHDLIRDTTANHEKISRNKINSIKKALMKFCEFVYYYLQNDNDKRLSDLKWLIKLNKIVNDNREKLQLPDDNFDVFKWIKKDTNI